MALKPWTIVLLVIGLTLAAFRPTDTVVDVSLDSSNVATYAWFASSGAHFGSDVISAVGPYGFVHYGYSYGGELYWPRFILELVLKAAFALLVTWLFCSASSHALRWAWLATVVIILPLVEDTVYDVTLLLAVLFLLRTGPRRSPDWTSHAVAVLLALLSLTKSTQIVLSLIGLSLVLLDGWNRGRRAAVGRLLGTFCVSYIALWLGARQNLGDLPSFFRGVIELSAGFNGAMGLEEPLTTTLLGIAILASLLGTCVWACLMGGYNRSRLLASAWIAGFSFVTWKHGFVRADGHVMFFFDFALVAALIPWLICRSTGATLGRHTYRAGLVLSVLSLSLAGYAVLGSRTFPQWLQTFQYAAKIRATQLANPVRHHAMLEAQLKQQRTRFDLPRLRTTIAQGSVDFFGYEQGYILLNRFRYQPRPMGGGTFSVYNEYLKTRNENFLRDPTRRPDFYLLKLDRLDQRLVSQEDSRAFLQLLFLYQPIQAEFPLYLLQQRPTPKDAPWPVELSQRNFQWGDSIDVPISAQSASDLILTTFSIELNWLGRLRSFVYKPPEVYLELSGDSSITTPKVRLIPAMARSPVLLSPLIENAHDFVGLYTPLKGKTVRSFRVLSSGNAFYDASTLSVRFYRTSRPPPDVRSTQVLALAHFPPANVAPELDDHKSNPHPIEGELADSFHAPARAVFPLTGREREIEFGFGIEAGAYLDGETDGAELVVELVQRPGETPTLLFRRHLQPKTVISDRGTHVAHIPLPLVRPGAKITLRADPGPHHSEAWDWVYITRFEILSGPRSLDQFPGFQTAPSIIDSPFAAPNQTTDGQHVFSLNAPGEMLFDLTGSESTLSFTCGLLPGAYSNGGNSDGVTVIVFIQRPGGDRVQLASYPLAPAIHPADRQPFDIQLKLPAHTAVDHLILRSDPGPNGDESWDWTYITNLRIY